MALKIIKNGTAKAASIQQIQFSEKPADSESPTDQRGWPDLPAITVIPPLSDAEGQEQPKPSVDLVNLEKTAYENGFAQGQKAGREIAEQKIEVMTRRYADSILELAQVRSSLYAQVEREVVKLAVEVAKKIVHREIQVDTNIIQTLVRVALSHVAEKSAVAVHLSPQDYSYLLEKRAELSQSEGRDISLLADRSIERGGCLIQTECGDVDARIEEKFKEVEHAFFEGIK